MQLLSSSITLNANVPPSTDTSGGSSCTLGPLPFLNDDFPRDRDLGLTTLLTGTSTGSAVGEITLVTGPVGAADAPFSTVTSRLSPDLIPISFTSLSHSVSGPRRSCLGGYVKRSPIWGRGMLRCGWIEV